MQLASRKPAEVAPARMGPLAKLPVFLDLAGKRVVLAGCTPAAVWKAELVAAAGAHVDNRREIKFRFLEAEAEAEAEAHAKNRLKNRQHGASR